MTGGVKKEYRLPVTVATYDVGADAALRLSAILRYQQEAGDRHLTPGGMGWQALAQQNMAFVASRWCCRIRQMPRLGETLSLITWHRERRGPRFFRCYQWVDAAGRERLCGVMQFALVTADGHRLLRGDEFERFGVSDNRDHTVDCPDPARWPLPPLSPAGDYLVGRSDIDLSGHMNNTRYADLLCNALPEEAAARGVVQADFHFAGECRRGDTLTLAAVLDGDGAYMQATTDRGSAFAARLILSPGGSHDN